MSLADHRVMVVTNLQHRDLLVKVDEVKDFAPSDDGCEIRLYSGRKIFCINKYNQSVSIARGSGFEKLGSIRKLYTEAKYLN